MQNLNNPKGAFIGSVLGLAAITAYIIRKHHLEYKANLKAIEIDTSDQIAVIRKAAELVKSNIKSGKYKSIDEALNDFAFQQIIIPEDN